MKKLVFLLVAAMAAIGMTAIGWSNPVMPPVITEFSTDPDWFEVYSEISGDLHYYILIVGNDTLSFPENTQIEGYQYLVFDRQFFPELDFPESGGSWKWTTPYDPYPFQLINYGNAGMTPAPPCNASAGYTFGDLSGEYTTIYFEPTPGANNQYSSPRRGQGPIFFNEININSTWPNGNFIELYTLAETEVDLSGWRIVGNQIYTIPQATSTTDYYVLRQADAPGFFGFDVSRDNIYLLNADGDLIDQMGWSTNHGENVSFVRYPDGDAWCFNGWNNSSSQDYENGFPSRNARNRYESPGFTVIGIDANQDDSAIRLVWDNPYWVSGFDRTYIIKNEYHYPRNVNDGSIVYEGDDEEYLDTEVELFSTYYYSAIGMDSDGHYSILTSESKVSITLRPTGIEPSPELPAVSELLTNYPNPFNSSTMIHFNIPGETGHPLNAKLEIFNLLGKKVATLFDGNKTAGDYSITWDASNCSGGVYFCKLTAGNYTGARKMVFIK